MNAPVLLSLLRGMPDAGSHGASLDAFYAAQAEAYDGFREHLLHGREQMVSALAIGSDHRLLDVGGGTARNLEFIDPTVLAACASVEILDLCRPLLAIAKRRVVERGWTNVILTHADACRDEPVHASVDRVMFSYSLSMIPDWHLALDRAIARLRPGGLLGIADFHVSTVPPPEACMRHNPWTRWFWPRWFRHARVHLRSALLPTLLARLEPVLIEERRGPVPYLPGARVPYLVFVGRPRLAEKSPCLARILHQNEDGAGP